MARKRRFDIVVLNHERLESFFGHWHRIRAFDGQQDRVTVLSCSPSPEERAQVHRFEEEAGVPVRYLVRHNRGIDQLARAEYFTGVVGDLRENLAYDFIFQMQEHYLDPFAPWSRWGPELDGRVKGDVAPDSVVFDLDRIEQLARDLALTALFCDRNDPAYIELDEARFIAPSGGNFIVRTDEVAAESAQMAIRELIDRCDDTYAWAVWAEFMWGLTFFREGGRYYDLKRDRLFERFRGADFYDAPDDFAALARRFTRPRAVLAVHRVVERVHHRLVGVRRAPGRGG